MLLGEQFMTMQNSTQFVVSNNTLLFSTVLHFCKSENVRLKNCSNLRLCQISLHRLPLKGNPNFQIQDENQIPAEAEHLHYNIRDLTTAKAEFCHPSQPKVEVDYFCWRVHRVREKLLPLPEQNTESKFMCPSKNAAACCHFNCKQTVLQLNPTDQHCNQNTDTCKHLHLEL